MAIEQNAVTQAEGTGGWETTPEPISTGTPCPQLGKRHRWNGGTVCVRCGATKEEASKDKAPHTEGTGETRVSTRTGTFETLAAMMWAGLGAGIELQPFVMTKNAKRADGTEIENRPVKQPVGRSFQMTAAIAGKRIDRAFHKASPLAYGIAAAWMKKTGWAADLAPLLVPPMVVYSMATYPQIVEKFKTQIAVVLMPVVLEMAKEQERQRKVMESMEGFNEETMQQAMEFLSTLMGNDTTSAT